jgi:hypothetical protein
MTTDSPTFGLPLAVRLRDESGPPLPQMVAQRREQLAQHIGCNVTTCPNSKCQATGECIDATTARQHVKISDRQPSPRAAEEAWREQQAKDPRNG